MDEGKFVKAVEPLVDEVKRIRAKVDAFEVNEKYAETLKGEPGKDADAQRVAEIIVEKYIDDLRGADGANGIDADPEQIAEIIAEKHADTLRGAQGESGPSGKDGQDGLGINVKSWKEGIYREGVLVQHNIGQVYKALSDTSDEPGHGDNWERVGTSGFRWTGVKNLDFSYQDGDLYIDGGTTFLFWEGKGRMIAQRGKNGKDGTDGKDGADGNSAANIVHVKWDNSGIAFAFDDGEIIVADVEGLETIQKRLTFLEEQLVNQVEDIDAPIKRFAGTWKMGESYSVGDTAKLNKGLYLCIKADRNSSSLDPENWVKLAGSAAGGGGGGGGSGISQMSTLIVDALLNMNGRPIYGVSPPRPGVIGDFDAVNKQSMQAAIAAGSLYQGTYKPATGFPNIPFLANTAFINPVGGAVIANPNAAAPPLNSLLDILVWFNMKGKGLDNFAAVLAAPLLFDVTFSNGTHKTYLLPAGNYADAAAVQTALNALTGTEAKFLTYVNGADFWVGVETPPQYYATSIVGQAGGGFPDYVPGPTSTVLNTYNWVVSTTDPNVPEYAPPGLPGIPAGTKLNNSDLLQFNATLKQFEVIRGGNLTQNFADQRYWQLNAGNMAWRDQPYAKDAVVYGSRFNAWFVASQNIVAGSPEPGTTQAGAIWRKINSTYGATVFFGKGDYDPKDTTAANNWGMPRGTYPSGQQPLNGDSYFDVLTGSTTDFVVTQNPPIYTISGTIGKTGSGGTRIGAVLGNADLGAAWPGTRLAPTNLANWYEVTLAAPQKPTSGVFGGQTIAAGNYLLGFSGDPDATNGGWFLVAGTPSATGVAWTVNTPHPQARPDTITPTVIWGFTRKYEWTCPAGIADGTVLKLLQGFTDKTQIDKIEIREKKSGGSAFEFELLISAGTALLLSPLAAISKTPDFKEIGATWDASGTIFIVAGPNLSGKTLSIIVTSQDEDLGLITLGAGTTTKSGNTINALKNYPDTEKLSAQLVAQSASADIQVPNWFTRQSEGSGGQVAFALGVSPKTSLVFTASVSPVADSSNWPQLIMQRSGSWVDFATNRVSAIWIANTSDNKVAGGDASTWASNNTGLHTFGTNLKGAKWYAVKAEVNIYKSHTTISTNVVGIDATGIYRDATVTVVYDIAYTNIDYIGYKTQTPTQFNATIVWQ